MQQCGYIVCSPLDGLKNERKNTMEIYESYTDEQQNAATIYNFIGKQEQTKENKRKQQLLKLKI